MTVCSLLYSRRLCHRLCLHEHSQAKDCSPSWNEEVDLERGHAGNFGSPTGVPTQRLSSTVDIDACTAVGEKLSFSCQILILSAHSLHQALHSSFSPLVSIPNGDSPPCVRVAPVSFRRASSRLPLSSRNRRPCRSTRSTKTTQLARVLQWHEH